MDENIIMDYIKDVANINNNIIEIWLKEVCRINNIPGIPSLTIVYLYNENNPLYAQYQNKNLTPRFDDWLKSTGMGKYYTKV